MCEIYRDASKDDELSIGEIEKVFDILKRLGVVYVSIGGGEPLLREDLLSVTRLLIRKGFMVRLLTNGTLVDEHLIKKLVLAGLKEISVSLDTLDSQKQAYICDCEGTWEKIMRSIDLFASLLPKKGRLLLINTVVSPLNIRELPRLSQFAEKKGYYISFVPIEADSSSEFSFTQSDCRCIDESYDYLVGMKKKSKNFIFNSSVFLEKSRQYLKYRKLNWECDAGRLYFSMNPSGKLSFCHRVTQELYFLAEDLKPLLGTSLFRRKRAAFVKGCTGCMRPCWAEISFIFNNKLSLWETAKIGYSSWKNLLSQGAGTNS